MIGFARLFEEVAGEKQLSVAHNVRAVGQHAGEVASGFAAHDARKTFAGLGHLIVDFVKIEAKELINTGTQVAKALDLKYREPLLNMAKTLRTLVPVIRKKSLALGGVDAGKIGWLINLIQVAIDKKRDFCIVSANTRPESRSKAARKCTAEGEGQKESVRHTEEAQHPGERLQAPDVRRRRPRRRRDVQSGLRWATNG